MQLAHTMLLGPTRVNEAKLNVLSMRDNITPTGDGWKRSTFGFAYPQIYPGGEYPDGIPNVQVNGMTYWKGPASGAFFSGYTDISFMNNFTWVHGRHTTKAGVMLIRMRKDQNGKSMYNGQVEFNNKANPNTTGVPIADALLGNFLTYSEAAQDPVGFLRYTQAEAYVSDSWKLLRRLSVEYGARCYWMQPAYAQANNITNFDPRLYDPSKAVKVNQDGTIVPNSGNFFNGLVRAGGGVPAGEMARVPGGNTAAVLSVPATAPRGFYQPAHLLAPRFGFAWAPSDRTTMRGGFGLYFNRPETSLISPVLNSPPYAQSIQVQFGNLANPAGGSAPAPSPVDTSQASDPHLKNSYTMNFSFSVQRELPRGVFAELAYVGNVGRHLLRQPDINQPTFVDYLIIAGYASSARPSVNAFRRYKGFSVITMRLSDSTSNYNSLQAYMTKRKGDLLMTASYTWAKALADTSKNSEDPEDPFNRHFNYGPATFDRRHVLVTTFNYRIPAFRNLRGVGGGVLGGWEASGVVRAQSGQMLSITCDSVAGVRRADYIGGPVQLPSDKRSVDHWFNTAAFVAAPDIRRGTSGVGILSGPGLYTWDTSLRKQFRVTERLRLRFQGDMTNAMNHANFRNLAAKTSSKTYGQMAQAGPARNIQFGLKAMF